jgi:hypothetical protein
MSSYKDVRTFTCMVDVYSYIASDLVPEVLHEHIQLQHVTVLLDCSIHFRDKVLSESLPKALGLQMIFDELSAFNGLLGDLAKFLILCHERVNLIGSHF